MPLLYFMHENISNRPDPKSTGRPRIYPLREILNAIYYVVRRGCSWRLSPHDFPPWRSVYHYLRQFCLDGTWARVHAALRDRVRVRLKRNPQPSAGIVDSHPDGLPHDPAELHA
jgi:putative transposase